MEELLPFLQKYEVWIYVVLGIVAFVYFQKLIVAWKDWQGTVYGLERAIAQHRFSTSLTVLVLLVVFVLMEFVIVSFIAPSYPQLAVLPTPTLDLLATPTVTLAAAEAATANVTPTVMTEVTQEGCTPGQIEWTFPQPGQEVNVTVELKGTVNIPNLGFYKYEYAKPEEENWNTIAAGNQAKVDGQIGFWNTSALVPGDYRLRLVVADNQNQLFPACIIPVRVVQ